MEAERTRRRALYEEGGCIFMPPVSELRMTVPVDHELAEPEKLQAWILDLAAMASPELVSGHAGLAVNFHEGVGPSRWAQPMFRRLAALVARHPGLGYDHPSDVLRSLLRYRSEDVDFVPHVKRVAWLTWVADRAVGLLGGLAAIEAKIATEASLGLACVKLAHGIMLRAGALPRLGDVRTRDLLPAYRAVAQLIRPVRLPMLRSPRGDFTDEIAQSWLEIFDRPDE
jgi:hypothetical protein